MKELFEYIKSQILARITKTVTIGGVPTVKPVFKTVRLWNNNFVAANTDSKNGKDYKGDASFTYPALFIEFIVEQVDNRCLGIKDYILTVRCRFGIEAYKFERLDTFDFCDDFSAAIQLMAPTEASGLVFTSFQEIRTEFDEDHNNVEVPYMDYRTRFVSLAGYTRKTDVVVPQDVTISPVITTTLDEEI